MSDVSLEPGQSPLPQSEAGARAVNAARELADQTARIEAQSKFRDELARRRSTVYLNCADGPPLDCDEGSKDSWFNSPTHQELKIADQVGDVLAAAQLGTTVQHAAVSTLFDLLAGGKTPSSKAPMRNDRLSYWELVTRPLEKQLVESLSSTAGTITNARMMSSALSLSGQDRWLAILTLANFSKNMAAIERRQIYPDRIAPELRSTYTLSKVDSIFQRIESFADDPNERYNKEGAIYHFYGAMFAASQIGPLASVGVFGYNNLNLRELGVGGRSDRIKDQAADVGAQFWFALSPGEWWPCQLFS